MIDTPGTAFNETVGTVSRADEPTTERVAGEMCRSGTILLRGTGPASNAAPNPVTHIPEGHKDRGPTEPTVEVADFDPSCLPPPRSSDGGPCKAAEPDGMTELAHMTGGTAMTACFVAGTRLATRHGATAVEDLREGDAVETVSGLFARVVWIGRREIDLESLLDDGPARPIRIAAGAFGNGLPRREVGLSGDHAVFTGGVLVPIRSLINGSTVRTDRSVQAVRYFHVELNNHEVILAEGLPVESRLDSGNRAMFDNDTPAAAIGQARRSYASNGYALLVGSGPIVEELCADLLVRATTLGQPAPAEVSVRIDRADLLRVELPGGAGSARLLSRSGQRGLDLRQLGALIGGLHLDGAPLPLYGAHLERGFHPCERHGPRLVRWTDGDATVRFPSTEATRWLEVEVLATVPECLSSV